MVSWLWFRLWWLLLLLLLLSAGAFAAVKLCQFQACKSATCKTSTFVTLQMMCKRVVFVGTYLRLNYFMDSGRYTVAAAGRPYSS